MKQEEDTHSRYTYTKRRRSMSQIKLETSEKSDTYIVQNKTRCEKERASDRDRGSMSEKETERATTHDTSRTQAQKGSIKQ